MNNPMVLHITPVDNIRGGCTKQTNFDVGRVDQRVGLGWVGTVVWSLCRSSIDDIECYAKLSE